MCVIVSADFQKLIDTNQPCNLVPDPYGKGLPTNRLYVAQRAGGNADLKIQTQLSPQIGCDGNGDGKLQQDEIINSPTTPFKALVITQNDYNTQRSWLNTWAAGWGSILYPVAGNLIKAFLNATAPTGAVAGTGSLSAGDSRLTHVAGAAFGFPSCTATVTNYDFPASTTTGLKIEKSDVLESGRAAFLKSKKAEVIAFFATNSVAFHTFVWTWNTDITFVAGGFASVAQDDLHFAFDQVHLQATVSSGLIRTGSV